MSNVSPEETLRSFTNDAMHVANAVLRLTVPGVVTVNTPKLKSLAEKMRALRAEFSQVISESNHIHDSISG